MFCFVTKIHQIIGAWIRQIWMFRFIDLESNFILIIYSSTPSGFHGGLTPNIEVSIEWILKLPTRSICSSQRANSNPVSVFFFQDTWIRSMTNECDPNLIFVRIDLKYKVQPTHSEPKSNSTRNIIVMALMIPKKYSCESFLHQLMPYLMDYFLSKNFYITLNLWCRNVMTKKWALLHVHMKNNTMKRKFFLINLED